MKKNKKMINVLTTIATVASTIVGYYFSDFNAGTIVLGAVIMVLWFIAEYLNKYIEDLEDTNDKLSDENDNLKDKIKVQEQQLSTISIVANQGIPYKILCLSNLEIDKGIKQNRDYAIEAIISTVNKQYEIKYVNISFNEKVILKQESLQANTSMYKLASTDPAIRNSRYEYSFELKKEYLDLSCAKCLFKIKYNSDKLLNMNVEVSSDDGISKTEIFSYKVIKS